jgi:hypothetical protein
MTSPRLWPISALLLVTCALLSIACGAAAKVREAADRATRSNDLKQIALAYMSFCTKNSKGPANADELSKDQPEATVALQRVKSGEFTILWGVNLDNQRLFDVNGRSITVLGYESTVPASGGLVLMCDGAVQGMTAAEFKAKPQAKSGGGNVK